MKPRKFLIIAFLLLATATTSLGQVTVGADMVTRYIWRGLDFMPGGTNTEAAPGFQPSVTYAIGETGLSANAWANFAMTRRNEQAILNADELDLTLSYDPTFGPVGVTAGITHFNNYRIDDWPNEFSTNYELYGGVYYADSPFTPGVTIYYAMNEDAWDGYYVQFSSGYSLAFQDNPSLDFGFSAGYQDQSLFAESGISDINLSVGTTLATGNISLTPSFTMTYVPEKGNYHDHLIFFGGLGFYFSK